MPASSSTSIKQSKGNIISLVGFQGSGKTTLGKHLASQYKCSHLEMSAIVRAIATGLSRDELPKTAAKTKSDPGWLAPYVEKLIEHEMLDDIVVLTGVRELQIHKHLIEKGYAIYDFEIKARPSLRYERLLEIHKVSSAEQFLNHELDEIKMGLRYVMDSTKYAVETTDDTAPKQLAIAMKKRLREKGVK